jgi:RNA polymerase sigma-70 factor (ECF subfamily)
MDSFPPPSPSSRKFDQAQIQTLVSACQEGDMEAFGKLYDIYIDSIYRYVYYRIDREEVEDVVETVFVRVWENIDKYRPTQYPFSSWLFRIAHNLVVDHYRFHRKHISLNEQLPAGSDRSENNPMEWAGQRLNKKYLREALAELKDSYQQVLVFKYILGFSHQEIAVILQRNVPNIRILQYRALRALRSILEERGLQCND